MSKRTKTYRPHRKVRHSVANPFMAPPKAEVRREIVALTFARLRSALAPKRICELPHVGAAKKYASPSASSTRRRGDANARMDSGNRRRGRDWPDLVVRRHVQLGPRGWLGNEFGRDI